mgnify:CR=1 FL=1
MKKLKMLAAMIILAGIFTGCASNGGTSAQKANQNSKIDKKIKSKMEFIAQTTVALAWRKQYCGIYRLIEKNVTYYYTVKACRITNENTYWSKIVDKVKSIKIYPAKPLLKAAKATAEGIKVTWNSTENTTKYFVYQEEGVI